MGPEKQMQGRFTNHPYIPKPLAASREEGRGDTEHLEIPHLYPSHPGKGRAEDLIIHLSVAWIPACGAVSQLIFI